MQIETERPKLAVEAPGEGVLGRLAGLNEMQLDARLSGPEKHRLRSQFRPVVADNGLGQ